MIINEKQMKEIEQLIPEHKEALVAYGADMYRRGIVAGAIWFSVGASCAFVVSGLKKFYKYQKKNQINLRTDKSFSFFSRVKNISYYERR